MMLTSLSNNSIVQFVTVTIVFIIVLAITFFTTRWIGSYQKKQISKGNIKIVESLRISNNKVLEVVNIGSKYFLIAVCKDTVTQIGEIDGSELKLLEESGNTNESFGNVFSRFKVVHKKNEAKDLRDLSELNDLTDESGNNSNNNEFYKEETDKDGVEDD